MAKCDSSKEMTWIVIRPSQDKKQRPDKRYFGNLSGVVFSVCPRSKIKDAFEEWDFKVSTVKWEICCLYLALRFQEQPHPATYRLVFRSQGTWSEDGVLLQAQLCQPIYQHQDPSVTSLTVANTIRGTMSIQHPLLQHCKSTKASDKKRKIYIKHVEGILTWQYNVI